MNIHSIFICNVFWYKCNHFSQTAWLFTLKLLYGKKIIFVLIYVLQLDMGIWKGIWFKIKKKVHFFLKIFVRFLHSLKIYARQDVILNRIYNILYVYISVAKFTHGLLFFIGYFVFVALFSFSIFPQSVMVFHEIDSFFIFCIYIFLQ